MLLRGALSSAMRFRAMDCLSLAVAETPCTTCTGLKAFDQGQAKQLLEALCNIIMYGNSQCVMQATAG